MSINEEKNVILHTAKSILISITEVTELVVDIETEHENFMDIGCFLHRTSPAVMELQTTAHSPPNVVEILNSLSKNVESAKELVTQFKTMDISTASLGVKDILGELESLIRNIGEDLNLIPSSTFKGQEYAECAIKSLSREMKNANIQMRSNQQYETEDGGEYSEVKIQKEEHEEVIEADLYEVHADSSRDNSSSFVDTQYNEMPRLMDFLRGMSFGRQRSYGNNSKSLKTLPKVAEYMEPLYETFFCPLTKKIMEDPVTIGSGVTYERKAVTEWFNKCEEGSQDIVCPLTGYKLESRTVNSNLALKITIDEWKERNEATRIKVVRAALSLASSESMIREALKDLLHLGRKMYNKVQIRNSGIIPLLVQLMEHEVRKVRCEAIETLQLLVDEDEESKEIIAQTNAISTTVKMVSSEYPPEKNLALSFLQELSKSAQFCEKIGSMPGAILLLITLKYSKTDDAFASEKADEALKNLEKCSKNVKIMAENGLLEPLLNHLVEGSEEVQMEMVSFLGETVLGPETHTYVAERSSTSLIKMVHNGNTYLRKAAFKALVHISSYHSNCKLLVEAGIVPIMIEEMFTRKIYNEPMDSKEESAAILSNILESGTDPQTLQVNSHGHTMASDYVIYNMVHLLKNSTPDEANLHLTKILLCLSKYTKAMPRVVSVIKEVDASYKLIELIDSDKDNLAVGSTKLLINLTPNMGHTIADKLCKTMGQPESLVKKLDTNSIKEKHAVWASFLAKLPHQNLTLNMALLQCNTVPLIIQKIHDVERGETRTGRFKSAYLEGIAGILVRFTATLYDAQILVMARANNLASVFTELLMRTGSDEVQRLAATGLENLSSESIHLSRPPQVKTPKYSKIFPKCFIPVKTKEKKIQLCPVHRGQCSLQTTFCLLDSKALEKLLSCLDNESAEVVEASLSAICTLLDDNVDVDKSVGVLSEVNTMQHVLNVLKEHRQEGVWQKSFWVIEKFIAKGDKSISDISNDRLLPATLVSAFHHGEGSTKEMAEKILRYLNKMPNFSSNVGFRS